MSESDGSVFDELNELLGDATPSPGNSPSTSGQLDSAALITSHVVAAPADANTTAAATSSSGGDFGTSHNTTSPAPHARTGLSSVAAAEQERAASNRASTSGNGNLRQARVARGAQQPSGTAQAAVADCKHEVVYRGLCGMCAVHTEALHLNLHARLYCCLCTSQRQVLPPPLNSDWCHVITNSSMPKLEGDVLRAICVC